jgi:hypothetical protein
MFCVVADKLQVPTLRAATGGGALITRCVFGSKRFLAAHRMLERRDRQRHLRHVSR